MNMHMRIGLFLGGLLLGGFALYGSASAQQMSDRDVQIELMRLSDRMARISQQSEQVLGDIRALQRDMEDVKKRVTFVEDKTSTVTDDLSRFRNTDVANLVAADKQLTHRIETNAQHIEKQTATWDWGTKTRDCEDLGRHQQIMNVKSADGNYTLRYLCFDGRAIHLGTEVNLPPRQ